MPQPEEGQLFPVYVFLGPEKGLKEDAVKQIRNSLEAKFGGCDVARFYAFEDYEAEMFAQLNNMDFFSAHKLIVLGAAEEIKGADKVNALVSYINAPSETATLVIISDEKFINRSVMDSVPKDALKIFYELFDSQKDQWLRDFFRRGGFSIEQEAIDAILEKVENNIQDMTATCSQMLVFLGTIEGKSSVTYDDVENFLTHTREEDDFSLFDYIAHRKLESALECFQTLVRTNDMASVTTVLPGRLASYFRRALSVSLNVAAGMGVDLGRSGDSSAFMTKVYETERPITMPKDKEIYRSCVRNYSTDQIEAIISMLAACDLEIRKTGGGVQTLIMEKCISDIIIRKGKPARPLRFATL